MISIRSLIMLSLLSLITLGCSQEEPKKMPTVAPDQKAANDKSHEEMKAQMTGGGSAAPAEAPK